MPARSSKAPVNHKTLTRALLFMLVYVGALGAPSQAGAVDCSNGDVKLSCQETVDSFGALECDTVPGSLVISPRGCLASEITNLNALTNITSIEGELEIGEYYRSNSYGNQALTNLEGLNNLVSVGGLRIRDNPLLADINALSNLSTIDGGLFLLRNDSLGNIDALTKVTELTSLYIGASSDSFIHLDGLINVTNIGEVNINNNSQLSDISGLSGLEQVGGAFSILANDALTDLDGLSSLEQVGGDLTISSNDSLGNIDGLSDLVTVGGWIYIYGNESLIDLDGLSNVVSTGSSLIVRNNLILSNLDGFSGITTIANGNLEVLDNPSLSNCQGLARILGWPEGPPNDLVPGNISISRNPADCGSSFQVINSITAPSPPVIITASAPGGGNFVLDFILSTTSNTAFPITGYNAFCTGADINVTGLPATDLLDNTRVEETLTVAGYDPTSVLSSIEVDIDITHSDPTDLYITLTTPEGTELVLWNQGSAGGENLIGTFPTTLTPVDSLDTVTRQDMDGDWVLTVEDIDVGPVVREGVLNSWGLRITEELGRTGPDSPLEVYGATRGRDYICTVTPITGLGTFPVSDPFIVTVPLELPAVPVITSTDYEDGKIILTISVSDNGGTDILEYGATCTDGVNTFTGTSPTPRVEVSGLTNGTAYTCTATATNTVGPSDPSVPTGSITPEELSNGLPVWLLYEATK